MPLPIPAVSAPTLVDRDTQQTRERRNLLPAHALR